MTATVKDLARSHSAHLAGDRQRLYLVAFHAGMKAQRAGEDTSRYVRSLIADGHAASTAGFLEGLAAARALAGAVIPTRKRAYYKQRKPGMVRLQAAADAVRDGS